MNEQAVQQTYAFEEEAEVFFNDGLDDAAVHISEPNTHHCAEDEQNRQEDEALGFGAIPRRNHILDKFENTFPENAVNIALAFALCKKDQR